MIVGLGIDIVEIDRIEQALARKGFARRILTPGERDRTLTARYVAGRWAAKEAAKKAFPLIEKWHQVEVLTGPDGRPTMWVHGFPALWKWHVSITHERSHAAAVVVLERPE
ncbi:MAG: holo-ACP synthase [Armatimonadetes bacterium]|nr:holo-ACP synthase [Armatimonadota bacterium]